MIGPDDEDFNEDEFDSMFDDEEFDDEEFDDMLNDMDETNLMKLSRGIFDEDNDDHLPEN